MPCPYKCGNNYSSLSSILRHLSQNHNNINMTTHKNSKEHQKLAENIIEQEEKHKEKSYNIEDLGHDYIKFVLTCKEILKLPMSTTNCLSELFLNCIINIGKYATNFENTSIFWDNLYKQLKTKKMNMESTLKENFKYEAPISIQLGPSAEYHYVSIEGNLHTILSNEFQLCQSLSDYSGSFWKSDYFKKVEPLIPNKESTIFLKIYLDEFEVVNPIGHATKKHSLLACYYQIMNDKPQHLSNLNSIYLAFLVKEKYVKKFGLEKVMKPFFEELNKLYINGMKFKETNIFVMALCCVGDNKSMHQMIGLSGYFAGGCICRSCYIDFRDIRNNEGQFNFQSKLRSNESFIYDAEHFSSGVKSVSPFLSLPYIILPDFFIFDIMHDFGEGSTQAVICTVIKQCLNHKILTLNDLNEELRVNLPYNYELNQERLNNDSIKLKCIETFLLLFVLPSLLADYVIAASIQEVSDAFDLLLIHIKILQLITSECECLEHAEHLSVYLEHLMGLHHDLFVQFRNKSKHLCKLHYLTHYPAMVKKYGNMKLFWTMRFEGAHRPFKNMARKFNNFKNLSLTLATRFQTQLCVSLKYKLIYAIKSSEMCILHDITFYEDQCLQATFGEQYEAQEVFWLKIDQTKVFVNGFIVNTKVKHDFNPEDIDYSVLCIKKILYINGEWKLLCNTCNVEYLLQKNALLLKSVIEQDCKVLSFSNEIYNSMCYKVIGGQRLLILNFSF